MRNIFREIESYTVYYHQTTLKLSCGHLIVDKIKNKWNIRDKISCRECLSDFEMLEMFVTNEDSDGD